VWVTLVFPVGACRQDFQTSQSLQSSPVQDAAPSKAAATGAGSNNPLVSGQNKVVGETSGAGNQVFIEAHVDHGAQLLLVDAEGHQAGYSPTAGRDIENISGASYTDDSITDLTDNSDEPAEVESKVLQIRTSGGNSYLLHVMPTGRTLYRLEFRCWSDVGSARVPSGDLGISSGEEHTFSISANANCSKPFVTGAFFNPSGPKPPLLSYASPDSPFVHLARDVPARIVIVYDRDISPSSFVATLNGHVITHLFHPKPGRIESLALPVKRGENIVQLNVSSARDPGNHSTDIFTIHLD
jgi:hypothetical protein